MAKFSIVNLKSCMCILLLDNKSKLLPEILLLALPIESIRLCHFKLLMVARHHVFEAKINGSYAKKLKLL